MGADVQAERYRVHRTLGRGGMGQVMLAHDSVLGRPVALKRLYPSGAGPESERQTDARFRREAQVGASLSHPNLVSIYDIVQDGDGLVIVMEYVDGETLRQALRRGRLAPDRALAVLRAVAAGLDHAHRHGIVHRDVKPGNVLLGSDGAVKLADLGLAAAADLTRITTSGALVGTIPYMAPEQLEGAAADTSTDVYALAAVAFETLSGTRARPEDNPLALAHAIANDPPPDLRRAWPDAPPRAAEVLARGMARSPSERPQSGGELVEQLASTLQPLAAGAPRPRRRAVAPASASTPRRHRGALALGAVTVAAAVAVVLALAGGGGGAGSAGSRHAPASHARRAGTASGAAASTAAGNPVAAVESFYGLAAAHRYAEAWALADPAFRSQLLGFGAFSQQQSHVSSIRFDRTTVLDQTPTDATVAVQTTPVVDGATQHCRGTVSLQRASTASPWLLHVISINC
jgi:serine/threonine-protein kinase